MLTEELVQTIKKLLRTTTLSQREIARKLRVNRGTVNHIANNKRFDVAAYKRRKAAEEPQSIENAVRCHGCGIRINVIPCQLCKVRRMLLEKKIPSPLFNRPEHSIECTVPELHEEEYERYLAIQIAKQRRGEKPVSNLSLFHHVLFPGEKTMPVFTNVKYIRWFLSNVDDLMPLLELPSQLRNATTITEKWDLLKEAGDLVAELIASFPIVDTPQAHSVVALQLEVEAQGVVWDKLLELLPVLIRLIILIQGEQE